jgi:integrase
LKIYAANKQTISEKKVAPLQDPSDIQLDSDEPDKERPQFKDTDIEDGFKQWMREEEDFKETTVRNYWKALKYLPAIDLITDTAGQITGSLLYSKEFDNTNNVNAIRKMIQYQFAQHSPSDFSQTEWSVIRTRKKKLIDGDQAHLSFEDNELTGNSDSYRTIHEDDHYIRKEDFVEFLRRVEPQKARFYLLQYFGGFRFKEVKLLTGEHWREAGSGGKVGDWGGVRVEESRTKSENPRTVNFYSNAPRKIFLEAVSTSTGEWKDPDTSKEYKGVIFSDLKQGSLNYQLGRYMKDKLYGAFPDITGERRTLHSLRHTRITDLVMNDISIGEVMRRSGHEYFDTTKGYTDNKIERPRKLEDYCEEKEIDLFEVVES